VKLHDRCPACGSPVCFHRREIGDRQEIPDGEIARCFACDFDFRRATAIELEPEMTQFHRFLSASLDQGWTYAPDHKPVYAHLYFDVLHQILNLILSGRSRNFGQIVLCDSNLQTMEIDGREHIFENLDVNSRHQLLALARWPLEDWPNRFTSLCRKNGIWSSWLLRDFPDAPYWFADVVAQHLYIRYADFDAEQNRKLARFKEKVRRAQNQLC
jgi:hypothetical protein